MEALWTIHLLNELRVSLPGREVTRFPLRKSASLLAYLAYYPQRSHPREILIEMLWPDVEPASGRNRLNLALSGLRQSLVHPESGAEPILSDRFAIRINPDVVTTDIAAYTVSLQAAARAEGSRRQQAHFAEAVALYAGELLPGYYDEWIAPERMRLAQLCQEALRQLARLQEAEGDIDGALGAARRLLAFDPEEESVQAELVRLQSLARRTSGAMPPLSLRTAPTIGPDTTAADAVPTADVALSAATLPAPGTQTPPLPQVYNLPPQLNAFVGRDEDVVSWHKLLLQPAHRLLTLTGFAGMGKTRLAVALAERSAPDFPDGVWWCELEQAHTADEMLRLLAAQLRLSPQPDLPLREQIQQFMAGRRLLLILDNLEQVVGASQVVGELLRAAPETKVLVTSRRALDLREETLIELDPLPEAAAITLFVERVQEKRTDFAMDAANEADVRKLCRRLEGVPLAIELAAARCLALTPRQMTQRLNERFRLLQSRSPELPLRQRALHSAIDWSYCLLTIEQRRVFAQLSVFVGGFTLEDVEAVCDGGNILECMEELYKHSFLRRQTDKQLQQERFTMLESLREYGMEQLLETEDEEEQIAQRHAVYFLEIAREQVVAYRTAAELTAVWVLEQQSGNLHAALRWAQSANRSALEAELSHLIGYYLVRRGFLHEAIEIVQRGQTAILPLRAEHPALLAALLRERAGLHLDYGETHEARVLAQEVLTLAAEAEDVAARARAENLLGQAAMHERERDYTAARVHFLRALAHAEQAGDTRLQGNITNNLGIVERQDLSGDPAEQVKRRADALRYLQTSLELRRANHDRRGLAETLNSLGVLAFYAGDWDDAWRYYAEAFRLLQELHNPQQAALMLANLGEVAPKRGEPERGVALLAAAERLLSDLRSPWAAEAGQMLRKTADLAQLNPAELQAHYRSLSPTACLALVMPADAL